MITLNSEKSVIQVEDWADIMARPGFVVDLNPAAHKLKSIIGRYHLPVKIRCGLSNCHTPHGKGYIVVTEDGHETNIGKDCGKTYFGVDFEIMSRKFDRDVDDFQNREILGNFNFKLDELESRIKSLREGERGADWAYKKIHLLLTIGRGCPDVAVHKIKGMIRARNPEVSIERRATNEEIERIEAQLGRKVRRPHYVSESIGQLPGFEALYPENDLRTLLLDELQTQIGAFQRLSISELTHAELRRWAKWTATVESTFDRAVAAAAHAQVLLTAEALGILTRSLPVGDQAAFRAFIRSLSQ